MEHLQNSDIDPDKFTTIYRFEYIWYIKVKYMSVGYAIQRGKMFKKLTIWFFYDFGGNAPYRI